MSYFDCSTATCLNQPWYFSGTHIVHGLCKPILKVSIFNSYIKLTLFIECYWPNAVKHTQRHKDLLRMTTSTAKRCLGWKRMNALNSLNNTVPLNVCNSGQSKFPKCSKTEEKMASFSEGSSPSVYHSSAAVWKTQTNRTKIWLTEMEKTSRLSWTWHHVHPVT